MNDQTPNTSSLFAAILAGALTGFYNAINKYDIIRTIILAIIGALVSFAVSSLLNEIKKRFKS